MSLPTPSDSLLDMRGMTKRFGATCALSEVDFRLGRGEVHALLGENGAGKSTLVKILSGALKPDEGAMTLEGRPYHPADPLDGRRRGVSMIYQELNLAPHLSVEENIILGREPRTAGFVRRGPIRARIRETLAVLHHPEIDLETPVRRLGVGARQIVEICRAVLDKAKILVMDEPTSSLTAEDTDRLFQVIRKLKSEGVSVIYISHFLEEVRDVADVYSVLRDGERAGGGRMDEATLDGLIQLMVGRAVTDLFPRVGHRPGDVVLRLGDVQSPRMAEPVSLDLRRGEILGLAGLIGAGRTETLRAVFGLDALERGTVTLAGRPVPGGKPWRGIAHGLGFLSEDRQGEGLALSRSIADNITLSRFAPYKRRGLLSVRKRSRAAAGWVAALNIRARGPGQKVAGLSGGNQQKVALARLLHQEADVLLLDEPTRGIDVASKSQVYDWIGKLAAEGKAIVFVSSYFKELLGVCDRIAVFHRGRIVGLRPAASWTEEDLMAASMTGKG